MDRNGKNFTLKESLEHRPMELDEGPVVREPQEVVGNATGIQDPFFGPVQQWCDCTDRCKNMPGLITCPRKYHLPWLQELFPEEETRRLLKMFEGHPPASYKTEEDERGGQGAE